MRADPLPVSDCARRLRRGRPVPDCARRLRRGRPVPDCADDCRRASPTRARTCRVSRPAPRSGRFPGFADRLLRRTVPAGIGRLDRGGGPDPLPAHGRRQRIVGPTGAGATEISGFPGGGAALGRGRLSLDRGRPPRPHHRRPADLPSGDGHRRGWLGAGRLLGAGDPAAPAASTAHRTVLAGVRHGQPRCVDRAAAARRPDPRAAHRCRTGRLRHLVRRPAPHRDRRRSMVGPGFAAGPVRDDSCSSTTGRRRSPPRRSPTIRRSPTTSG